MSKFTVEEINFMCVLETQDRTDMIGQIRQIGRASCRERV